MRAPFHQPQPGGMGIRARRVVQMAGLLLYLWLFLATAFSGAEALGLHVGWFLRFDPLLLVADTLARGFPASILLWALLLVAATLVLGRFFCGWFCPLGTLLDAFSRLVPRNRRMVERPRLRNLKYYLLLALLIPIPFSGHLVGLLDPLCLLTRTLAVVGYPGTVWIGEKLGAAYGTPLAPVTEPVYQFLRHHYLPVGDYLWTWPLFRPTLVLFLTVFGLEFLGRRFWCKYLCPLGALLSALSVFAWLRRTPGRNCRDCGLCAPRCKAGAYDLGGRLRPNECMLCLTCDSGCPEDRVRYRWSRPRPAKRAPDLTRRSVVFSIATGVVAGPGLGMAGLNRPGPRTLRPPGAQAEARFLRQCARCGACSKVCPTQGLVPTLLETGPGGLWTPVFDFCSGYCELGCTLCGQVCPTGAIPHLMPEVKAKTRIGLASFDEKRCLPFAKHENCLVCEEVCPTGEKAIVFDARRIDTPEGPKDILFPRVRRDLCIGCGICENKCPLEGDKGVITFRTEAVPPEPPPPPGVPVDVDQVRSSVGGAPYGGPYGD